MLSLLLAALARSLARTHLAYGRLSEDLDLVAVGPRRDLAARLDSALPRALLRGYGRLGWQPALSAVRDIEPASLVDGQGLVVKVQLLKSVPSMAHRGSRPEPALSRRPTGGAASATLAAFAAWKTAAWCDRRAPRDL
ncbi:MAG TPA: hypothetical protein VJ914_18775 [Pseudonocardiaceae bacterium]|nr:hypothetical protein [Pseudonocardiaceae bacterium]